MSRTVLRLPRPVVAPLGSRAEASRAAVTLRPAVETRAAQAPSSRDAAPHRLEAIEVGIPPRAPAPIQRKVGFEFETNIGVKSRTEKSLVPKQAFYSTDRWHIEPDSDYMEFVTEPLDSHDEVNSTMSEIVAWVKEMLAVDIIMPNERLGDIDERQQTETEESLRHELMPILSAAEAIEKLEASYGIAKETATQWTELYDMRAVTDLVLPQTVSKFKGIEKDDVPILLSAMVKSTHAALKLAPTDYDEQRRNVKAQYAYRPLETMKTEQRRPAIKVGAYGDVHNVTAAPQATIGVPLADVVSALHLLPSDTVQTGLGTQGEQTHTLGGGSLDDAALLADARDRAVKAVSELRESAVASAEQWRQLEGLLGLVCSYVLKGTAPRDRKFQDAKDIAPLMTRVNFSVMYDVLPVALQKLFTPQLVAQTAGVGTTDLVYGKLGFGKSGVGPTVSEWIVSIAAGGDLMSKIGGGDVVTDKIGGSPGMGEKTALDKTDKLAPQGLVPLELRRIPKGIALDDWASLAHQISITSKAFLKSKFY